MFENLQPGRYVVAVSGGVDSMVLLDILRQHPDLQLIVAHYDHGIRDDSAEDKKLVASIAGRYGLPFVHDEGKLGADASEATARSARYAFLHTVREKSGANAIITAHHQDDMLETAILNALRGTGRKGLTSLGSTDLIARPLLHVGKKQLVEYAKANGLEWREDSTNKDSRYKRNYVRSQIVAKLTPMQRHKLLAHVRYMQRINHEIESELANHLHVQPAPDQLDTSYFRMLPHAVSLELLAAWLRHNGVRSFDAKGLNRMTVSMKTYAHGRAIDVNQAYTIEVGPKVLALKARDR